MRTFPLPLLCLISFFPLSAFAQPRINQISPHPSASSSGYRIEDIDGDGFRDIILEDTYGYMAQRPLVVRNLGSRNFAPPMHTHYRVIDSFNHPIDLSGVLVELDGPGDFRILTLARDYRIESEVVLHHQVIPVLPGGTFGERTPLPLPTDQAWLPVDLDGDHRTEFVAFIPSDGGTTTLVIQDRQPDGSYAPTEISFPFEVTAHGITAADLNSDGQLDLIARTGGDSFVLERTGTRSFSTNAKFLPINQNLQIGDLDGDGQPDLFGFNYQGFDWMRNVSTPGIFGLGPLSTYTLPDEYRNVKPLRVVPQAGEDAIFHFALPEGTSVTTRTVRFRSWETISEQIIQTDALSPPPTSSPQTGDFVTWLPSCEPVAISDLDNDGRDDFLFVVNNRLGEAGEPVVRRLAVAWGTEGGYGPPVYTHPAPISSKNLIVGNFDSQPAPDFITGPDVEGGHWFFGNTGDGSFNPPVRIGALDLPAGCPPGTRISNIVAADVTNDGVLDLVVSYSRTYFGFHQGACVVAPGAGDGTFLAPELPAGAFDTVTITEYGIDELADWDGDGDLDIISNGSWRENLGGTFSLEYRPLIDGAFVTDVLGNLIPLVFTRVGDVDGDGHPDIISLVYRIEDSDSPSGGIFGGPSPKSHAAVAFNDGHGGIGEIAEIPITLHSYDVLGNPVTFDLRIADINGDGLPDLCYNQSAGNDVLGNPLTTSKWRRNPGGSAARNPAQWIALPFGSDSLPMTVNPELDFDGDGRKDWPNANGYVRPTPTGPAVSPSYDFTGGADFQSYQPRRYFADFDGDGDIDTLVTDGAADFSLVRNLLIDERSAITRHLVAAGMPGLLSQPHADADGDGTDNQTELLFGSDPLAADTVPGNPLGISLDPSESNPSLSFRLPAYATALGLEYEIEHSVDLVEWVPLSGTAPSVLSETGGWNYLSLPLECSGPCGYFRIRGSHRPATE